MKVAGALVREQGQTFAIVMVRTSAMETGTRDGVKAYFQQALGGVETVLAATYPGGRLQFYGRRDIVQFLSGIDASRIPWGHFDIPG